MANFTEFLVWSLYGIAAWDFEFIFLVSEEHGRIVSSGIEAANLLRNKKVDLLAMLYELYAKKGSL
jgi:hypothetical protein